MTTRSNLFSRLAMLGLCLVFFGLWAHDLARPAVTGDEAFIAIVSRQSVDEILTRLNTDEPHPPLFYLSMAGWSRLFNREHEFLLRLPAVFAGLLALSLTYRLGRELGLSAAGALAGAALLGLDPQLTLHVREARMYGPMIATAAAAAVLTVRAVRNTRGRGPLWAAALGCLTALLTHYFNALFIGPLALWALGADRRRWRAWVTAQVLVWTALGVWLAVGGHGFFNPANLSTGKTWSFLLPAWETLARLAAVGAAGYRAYAETPLTYFAAPLLVALWLAGVWASRGRTRWFLLLMVTLPLGAYAVLGMIRPVFHPKYTLPWLVFVALGAGAVVARWRRAGLGLTLSLALCLAWPAWDTLRRPYEASLSVAAGDQLTSLPRDLGAALQDAAGPRDTFGLTTPDPAHCYYTERYFPRDLGCALLPAYPDQSAAELGGQTAALLAQQRILWLLDFYNPAWDPQKTAAAALNATALNLGTAALAGRTLTLYAAPAAILKDQTPVNARMGDFAELEGVWIAPAPQWRVVLIWRALAEQPAVDAKVFVHLIDDGDTVLAQADSVPVNWARPFATWHQDEQLLDVHVLDAPAGLDPNGLRLRVGAYNPTTLERLSVTPGGDAVTVPAKVAP